MDRGVEVGVVADLGGEGVLGRALGHEQRPQALLERAAAAQRRGERLAQRRRGGGTCTHERIQRRPCGRGQCLPRESAERLRGGERTEVEDLRADRDAATEGLAAAGAPKGGERQVLDGKVAARGIGGGHPARELRIVRRVDCGHGS